MTDGARAESVVHLWRIGATTRAYAADDLSGNGAASNPGRWNQINERVVYAAPTIAMAVLETAAHLRQAVPFDRYVVRVAVPREIWIKRKIVKLDDLAVGWDAVPGSIVAARYGSNWYTARSSALIELPSVIVPEETVVVVNASHPDAPGLTAKTIRRFEYERLFRTM